MHINEFFLQSWVQYFLTLLYHNVTVTSVPKKMVNMEENTPAAAFKKKKKKKVTLFM